MSSTVSTLLIALFFILQYLFDMNYVCACRPGLRSDWAFLGSPTYPLLCRHLKRTFLKGDILLPLSLLLQ